MTSNNATETTSIARTTASQIKQVTVTNLRCRRIQRKLSIDEKLQEFKSCFKTNLSERWLKKINSLQAVAQEFLQSARDDSNEYYDSHVRHFLDKIEINKADMGFVSCHSLQHVHKNKATLHQNDILHLVNPLWLDKTFHWNSETEWSQSKSVHIPSRGDDEVPAPKPDFVISFTRQSLVNEEDDCASIPLGLEQCISPDGGDRYFPFLFMEIEKVRTSVQEIYMINWHNASQALYNIYVWKMRGGQEKAFFDIVRVFTFIFDDSGCGVRIHRASRLDNGSLSFRFDEFWPLTSYVKDEASLLTKTILTDYAAKELRSALKSAYTEVIKQKRE